ncbi:MAG: GNAT family N-acetyltransferase [Nitratireductor sp.]
MILSAKKQKATIKIERKPLSNEHIEILAETAGIDGSHWQLSVHSLTRKSEDWAALQTLADNAQGVNPFYEPKFLNALRGRFIRKNDNHLILWETVGEEKRAKIAYPVKMGKINSKCRTLTAFQNEYAPIATPLLDNTDSAESMKQFAQLIDMAVKEKNMAFRIPNMCTDSPFNTQLEAQLGAFKSATLIIEAQTRCALKPENGSTGGLSSLSKKRVRELKRLKNKLGEQGKVEIVRSTDLMDVLIRFEEFLLLEMKSWKGRKGTSMQMLKKAAAFGRQATTELSKSDKCEVFSLRLDNKAIAILINFYIDGRSYPWKITYDEEFASRSPGTILIFEASQELLSRPDFVLADSLAKPGKSWLSAIWRDTLTFNDVTFAPTDQIAQKVYKTKPIKEHLKLIAKRILKRT